MHGDMTVASPQRGGTCDAIMCWKCGLNSMSDFISTVDGIKNTVSVCGAFTACQALG